MKMNKIIMNMKHTIILENKFQIKITKNKIKKIMKKIMEKII